MSLNSRLQALENTREGRIAVAVRTQNFGALSDDELDTVIGMAEASLRSQGKGDEYFAAVDLKLSRLTDAQLDQVMHGLPLEAIE